MDFGMVGSVGWTPAASFSAPITQSAAPQDAAAFGADAAQDSAAAANGAETADPDAARIAQEKAQARVMENQFNKECETCKNRTYQDGSNDPGVSFKSAQHIDPAMSASIVAGHEMEHVGHEQAKAKQSGGQVISQSVRLHGAFCPECGRYYIAGGVTETTVRHGSGKSQSENGSQGGNAGLDITA